LQPRHMLGIAGIGHHDAPKERAYLR
jgi:hypothetical protein